VGIMVDINVQLAWKPRVFMWTASHCESIFLSHHSLSHLAAICEPPNECWKMCYICVMASHFSLSCINCRYAYFHEHFTYFIG
jgi:hypothetical protein